MIASGNRKLHLSAPRLQFNIAFFNRFIRGVVNMNAFFRTLMMTSITAFALTAGTVAALAKLEHGNSGAAVKQLQQLLKDKNFYKGKIDGKFGDGTERAVRSFQEEKKVKVDGKVGDETWSLLKPSVAPEPKLKIGDTGDAVKKLQGLLKLKADGKFGQKTKNAVIKIQRQEGMNPDGIVGPDTWERLTPETS
jgi:peptidoglycan hydrolase-like protein with peptidoglycan-binding domain